GPLRETSRRFRRAVPDGQLRGDRRGGDVESRDGGDRGSQGDLRAAGIGKGRDTRHDAARDPRTGSHHSAAVEIMPTKMRPFGKTIALEEARAIIARGLQTIVG